MVRAGFSMKSTLRKTVMEAYRSRGKGISNLWLVYSAKTNSDWILPSDRQLIHWLYFLEANPDVRTFDLAPEPILSESREEGTLLPFHGSICGCPAEGAFPWGPCAVQVWCLDRKSTRLNSSHHRISYAVFCLKKKK